MTEENNSEKYVPK